MKTESANNKRSIVFIIIALAMLMPILILVAGGALMLFAASKPIESYYYETTSLADYGDYIGNNDNGFAWKFISSFFPQEIQDNFTDITYSYRAEDFDVYGFEAYLEFTIEDQSEFIQHIESIAAANQWHPFAFDPDYMEYCIVDELELSTHWEDGGAYEHPHIMEAEIGKILYAPEEQKIIYVAIAVYDGGGVTTEFLSVFFERFNINPVSYLDRK